MKQGEFNVLVFAALPILKMKKFSLPKVILDTTLTRGPPFEISQLLEEYKFCLLNHSI